MVARSPPRLFSFVSSAKSPSICSHVIWPGTSCNTLVTGWRLVKHLSPSPQEQQTCSAAKHAPSSSPGSSGQSMRDSGCRLLIGQLLAVLLETDEKRSLTSEGDFLNRGFPDLEDGFVTFAWRKKMSVTVVERVWSIFFSAAPTERMQWLIGTACRCEFRRSLNRKGVSPR